MTYARTARIPPGHREDTARIPPEDPATTILILLMLYRFPPAALFIQKNGLPPRGGGADALLDPPLPDPPVRGRGRGMTAGTILVVSRCRREVF